MSTPTRLTHPAATRTARRAVLTASLLAFAVFLSACGSDLPITDRSTAYTGPAATLDSTGPRHVVVIQAPTAGHLATLDAVRDRFQGREALITIRQPDPRFLVAQVITEHRVGTEVPSTTPLDIFIRVLPRESRENRPYLFVRSSAE